MQDHQPWHKLAYTDILQKFKSKGKVDLFIYSGGPEKGRLGVPKRQIQDEPQGERPLVASTLLEDKRSAMRNRQKRVLYDEARSLSCSAM